GGSADIGPPRRRRGGTAPPDIPRYSASRRPSMSGPPTRRPPLPNHPAPCRGHHARVRSGTAEPSQRCNSSSKATPASASMRRPWGVSWSSDGRRSAGFGQAAAVAAGLDAVDELAGAQGSNHRSPGGQPHLTVLVGPCVGETAVLAHAVQPRLIEVSRRGRRRARIYLGAIAPSHCAGRILGSDGVAVGACGVGASAGRGPLEDPAVLGEVPPGVLF